MPEKNRSVSRRKILLGGGLAAVAAGAVSFVRKSRSARIAKIPKGGKIVVVGAGFAGIGAARTLSEQGYNVEVVEARDRVGGRAYTADLGGDAVDLGAAWLHDSRGNMLFDVVKELNVPNVNSNFSDALVTDVDGAENPQAKLEYDSDQASALIEEVLTTPYLKWQAYQYLGISAPKVSVEDAFKPMMASLPPMVACALQGLVETQNAVTPDKVHAVVEMGLVGTDPFGQKEDAPEERGLPAFEVLLPNGMGTFAATLADDLNISLNEPVSAIEWSDTGATVTTNKRSIEADAVIVTVSAGLLKAGKIQFGEGGLPASHKAALDSFGMGVLNKVVLRYPDGTDWNREYDFFNYCGDAPVHFSVNALKLFDRPLVIGLCGGQKSLDIETADDAALVAGLHAAHQAAIGQTLPDPVDYVITRWRQDEWALGSYSYPNMSTSGYETEALRAPIGGRVLLSGEALSVNKAGTVNGAFFDGVRAANLLISSGNQS